MAGDGAAEESGEDPGVAEESLEEVDGAVELEENGEEEETMVGIENITKYPINGEI